MSELDELRSRVEVLEQQVQGWLGLAAQIGALTSQVRDLTTQVSATAQVLEVVVRTMVTKNDLAELSGKVDLVVDWIQSQP